MTLDELYPYWDDSHQEFVEAVTLLKEWQLDTVPGPGGRSLHQILLDFIRAERYWVGYLVNGFPEYRPQIVDFPDGPALAEALKATRAVTALVLEPFGPDGLRAVRTVPGDPATNRYETNRPVGWLFWQVLELELVCRGQLLQRVEDEKARG
ncbi:MAG: DinB family protein [Janthinobacterium lividum]